MLHRRAFIGGLIATLAAPAIVRADSIWIPPAPKLIRVGTNQLLNINMITREAVRLWKNSNDFIQNIDMQYNEAFALHVKAVGQPLRIGQTIKIRLPALP